MANPMPKRTHGSSQEVSKWWLRKPHPMFGCSLGKKQIAQAEKRVPQCLRCGLARKESERHSRDAGLYESI